MKDKSNYHCPGYCPMDAITEVLRQQAHNPPDARECDTWTRIKWILKDNKCYKHCQLRNKYKEINV